MKILTITCHDVFNYGASLQAYALMKYLENQGHDVEIIDYKPSYSGKQYNFWRLPKGSRYYQRAQRSSFFRFLFCMYLAVGRYRTIGRYFAFKRFNHNYLHLTRRFESFETLCADAPSADAYIAGSDQIWNTELPNGKDPAFFLNFGSPQIRRIAYAASFGISEISPSLKNELKQHLSVFNHISVREKSGVKILNDMGYNAIDVADPVLLLDKSEWINIFKLKKSSNAYKYILVYDLMGGRYPDMEKFVRKCAEENGYRIIALNNLNTLKYADENIISAGPEEFLEYLFNASYVVSTSFHATAFSTIFNIPFACFYKQNNSSRMTDFLKTISLELCMNPELSVTDFDWDTVNRKLSSLTIESKNFLIGALE